MMRITGIGGKPPAEVRRPDASAPATGQKIRKKAGGMQERVPDKPVAGPPQSEGAASLFTLRLHQAQHGRKHGPDPAVKQHGRGQELAAGESQPALLVSIHPWGVQVAPAAHAAHAPVDAGLSGAQRVEWVDGLVTRIDQALMAAPRTADGFTTVAIQLASDGVEGLRGVELFMSPMALDIVLSRSEGQATAEYLAATQVLAQRLHERFPTRIVRIHEVLGERPRSSAPMDGVRSERSKREGEA